LIGSGAIPEATAGDTWKDIDVALRQGLRGLKPGRSLPQLLAERRGVRTLHNAPPLTERKIVRLVDAFHRATGTWPLRTSGFIEGQTGETWAAIHAALSGGSRGLPGGSSLAQLLQKYRGVRNKSRLPRLSKQRILHWADEHRRQTGEYPNAESGPILGAPGETWKAVQMALVQGLRGLPGGTSLAKFLQEHRGVISRHRRRAIGSGEIGNGMDEL
jgi:hypothetical protein